MKIKITVLFLIGIALIGCATGQGSQDLVNDEHGWAAALGLSDFVARENADGYITMFTIGDQAITTTKMTDGNTKGAIRPDDEIARLITQYQAALAINPNDYEACIILAGLFIDRNKPGDAEQAVRYSNMAVAISSDGPHALYARSLSYFVSGEYDKSVADLQSLMRTNLQTVKGAHYLMGVIYSREWENLRFTRPAEAAAKLEASIDAFEKVAIFDPNFADVKEILPVLYTRRN
ncbi:MAG: hypothetical protein FWD14_08610 [Treponema sp.]|nr:hypothetical protein [Treponema sp.]